MCERKQTQPSTQMEGKRENVFTLLTIKFVLKAFPISLHIGVKKCHTCKQSIYHEKWKVTPELAEARWAHEQAKNRELGEVVDFVEDWKS